MSRRGQTGAPAGNHDPIADRSERGVPALAAAPGQGTSARARLLDFLTPLADADLDDAQNETQYQDDDGDGGGIA